MRHKRSTKFDTTVRFMLWIVICIFTGIALVDVAYASSKRRTARKRSPGAYSVIQPPPPNYCQAINAQIIISAIDTPTQKFFTVNSSVLCGGGIKPNSQCAYFLDWTLYYQYGGVWWFSNQSTQQYYDTCGQRDAQSFDVPTGIGNYYIEVKAYAGDATNGTQKLLQTSSGTFNF